MDSGTVVWLPGSGYTGYDDEIACEITYGYHACGSGDDGMGNTVVYCCPS